jgi:hypothetical protein
MSPREALLARVADADARGNTWLAKANALREAGEQDAAERCYAKGQFWMDRSNALRERMVPEPTLPWDAYRWNKAIRGAFRKGAIAHRAGLPQSACPYGDKRKPDGRLSWSRSFISAWQDGWRWSENGKAW